MSAKSERHSGLHRGQSVQASKHQSHSRFQANQDEKVFLTPKNRSVPITNGCKLRSGIIVTFPDEKSPEQENRERAELIQSHRISPAEWSQYGRKGRARNPRRGKGDHNTKNDWHSEGTSHSQTEEHGVSQAAARVPGSEAADLIEQMRMLKAAASRSQYWLNVTWKRQLEVEKGMAEEQARQAEMQAQTLILERAQIKAEKEQLERCHNDMAARLQILEGIIGDSEVFVGEEEELSLPDDIESSATSTEVLSQSGNLDLGEHGSV